MNTANNINHFAINADDTNRAKTFYTDVFGWQFSAFGPPDFWRIHTGAGAVEGALQKRRTLIPGQRNIGFECTIGVNDIKATQKAILEAGGTILMPETTISGVGHLLFFKDSEGNVVGAMQYDANA